MTPKEKAKELILKFAFKGAQHEGESKVFALITVDYILNSEPNKSYFEPNKSYFIKGYWMTPKTYWKEVKEELEKL